MGQIKSGLPTNLRELRKWHHVKAAQCRGLAKGLEAIDKPEQAKPFWDEAALHDSAVEVLNDVVEGPVSDD
jgi:hypothetical protein